MARILIILGLLGVIFWVFSIVDCAVQPRFRHRGVSKVAWLVIVSLLPVIGGIMWFTVGRSKGAPGGTGIRRAPDDDPNFIGTLGSISDQDERIRRLEEELAQLDAEDDDPRWNRPQASGALGDQAGATGAEEQGTENHGAEEYRVDGQGADPSGSSDEINHDDPRPSADPDSAEGPGDRPAPERDSNPDQHSNDGPRSSVERKPGGDEFPGQRGARG